MKKTALAVILTALSTSLHAANDQQLAQKIDQLKKQSEKLQQDIDSLQQKLLNSRTTSKHQHPDIEKTHDVTEDPPQTRVRQTSDQFHSSLVSVHAINGHPESLGFYPTALIADEQVVTYIAGTPVVTSPYLGDRPAFDGSDYIVNISSINRDVRLMQQRRRLYEAYSKIGYPVPHMPIIAISGKTEPFAFVQNPYVGKTTGDFNLGSSELDVAAALNENVEAFMSIAYDDSPTQFDGPRVDNSRFFLNMGFINIGNLDKTPIYFTAGQMFIPFGRFSSAMISAPLTMRLGRTKSRPFIIGYKTQYGPGPFAAVYGYKSETLLGHSGVGGINLGYTFEKNKMIGEIGASYNGSLSDAAGLQFVGPAPRTTFGGFSSVLNGSERIRKVPGLDFHGNVSFDSLSFTAEWVGATQSFRPQDLSFNGRGARPQAGQLEAGMTFMAFEKPASVGVGYQWSRQALAIQLPKQSYLAVFNISLWKDTVESIEYRHDIDYNQNQVGNGIAPLGMMNAPVIGTGKTADTVSAQIGVYF